MAGCAAAARGQRRDKNAAKSNQLQLCNRAPLFFFFKFWDSSLSLGIQIAQKPSIIGSLGPKALKYESFEGKGIEME